MRAVRSRIALSALIAIGSAAAAAAQSGVVTGRALNLERRGRYEEAAAIYHELLAGDRANDVALLGLERVLTRLAKLESLVSIVDSMLITDSANKLLHQVELRAWASLDRPDSVSAAGVRWVEIFPDSVDPYRHWAIATSRVGRTDKAIDVLLAGRKRLGGTALAPELGRMYVLARRWVDAAREWTNAVRSNEHYVAAGAGSLKQVPEVDRDNVLRVLSNDRAGYSARRLAAETLVAWGRPEEGWTMLNSILPSDGRLAAPMLRRFADRARAGRSPAGERARGYALERLAEISTGDDAARARLAAARAFADAGALSAARRVLERINANGAPADAAAAMATLIRVTVEGGNVEEAEKRLREWDGRLHGDDASRLKERIAWAWAQQGKLDRAENILQGDSTVGTSAVRGWLRLFRGDLKGATEYFRAAGPYAESREEATRRTAMLALIQRIAPDSVPRLGEALLAVFSGDTGEAVDQLERVARELPLGGGRADVLTYGGQLAQRSGDMERAKPLLTEALQVDSVGPAAPLAEFALALVYSSQGRKDAAVRHLEHLIISHASSAVVPEARRLLDRVRGVIPQS